MSKCRERGDLKLLFLFIYFLLGVGWRCA